MNFIEQMIKNKKDAEKTIDPRVLKVFKENKQEIFYNDIIENQSEKKRSSYVYEWYTGDGKIFYVGKGVGNRINHILYDELKNDKPDGKYNYLNNTYGIYSRKVIENLTDWEAGIFERYQIRYREKQGEVLFQAIDSTSYFGNINEQEDKLNIQNQEPFIFVMPYHKRYYNYKDDDFKFDTFDLKQINGVYLYNFNWRENNLLQDTKIKLLSLGIKIYKTRCKAVDTVFVSGLITSDQYLMLKKQNYKIMHIKQIKV
ncbi:MAG: hypothetical protein J6B20_01975 [Clostridia bacterium]|nr:hypothetical protein [Clostridia bacterium]